MTLYLIMDITSLVPIVERLRNTIKVELENIKEVKNHIIKSGEYELAANARDLEKKVLEMQKMIDPMG